MKPILISIAVCFLMLSGCSNEMKEKTASNDTQSAVKKYKGQIVDNICATGYKGKMGELVTIYSKEKARSYYCKAGGYSLYTDGTLIPFDKSSGEIVDKYLSQPSGTLNVMVTAENVNDELHLISISNTK